MQCPVLRVNEPIMTVQSSARSRSAARTNSLIISLRKLRLPSIVLLHTRAKVLKHPSKGFLLGRNLARKPFKIVGYRPPPLPGHLSVAAPFCVGAVFVIIVTYNPV